LGVFSTLVTGLSDQKQFVATGESITERVPQLFIVVNLQLRVFLRLNTLTMLS